MGLGLFKRISGFRLRNYRSVQMLNEGINIYMGGVFPRAADTFEKLCEQKDEGNLFQLLLQSWVHKEVMKGHL